MKNVFYAAAFFLIAASSSQAAEECFETVNVPAAMVCTTDNSNSADFTHGCKFNPATTKQVKVECPPKQAQWVAAGPLLSQSTVCGNLKMDVSNIDGAVCKSVEQSHGTVVGAARGNALFSPNARGCRDSPCDTIAYRVLGYENSGTIYTCWSPGQRQDMDRTDGVTQYACMPR